MRVLIGQVDVDSGCLMLGDPCYIKDGFENRFDMAKGGWQPSPEGVVTYFSATEHALDNTYQVDHPGGGPGFSVCFNTAFGDGTYPVYAEIIDGRVQSVTVEVGDVDED